MFRKQQAAVKFFPAGEYFGRSGRSCGSLAAYCHRS